MKPGNKAGRGRGGGGVGRRPGLAIGSKRTSRVSALLNVDRNILKQAGINASKLQLVKKLINVNLKFSIVLLTR